MFSMRKFLNAHWADPAKLRRFIEAYGVEPPTRAAIVKWYDRESIPALWFATLLVLLEQERGKPVSLIGYQH